MNITIRHAVMAVIVNTKGMVLIGSSPRDGGYKFPQGGLEPNEDVVTGVKRELKEELGISVADDDILCVCQQKVSYHYPADDPYYIFKAQELSVVKIKYNTSMKLVPQDDEFDKLHWIHPKDLSKFDVQFRLEAYIKALELCRLF